MSIDASMLEATWWGVAAAGVAGLGGLAVGLVGLAQAKAARKLAADANKTALDAVEVAREANAISVGANDLSAEANAISRQTADRGIEDHDVHWYCGWESRGMFMVRNDGRDTAYDVRAAITVEGEQQSSDFPRLDPGQRISMIFKEAATRAATLEQALERREASRRTTDHFGMSVPEPVYMDEMETAFIVERIRWKSELGTPQKHDSRSPLGPPSP
ncbi:hypothetical protein [Clavibacter capsici]|uniref:hypothetical protein n=1 Tax=Clavibacter capsici TaxID=1874630 RepID=UPI0006B229DD|nr:hypothetical protein [Clavibacter capsici]ALD13124.1 hypothetical protein AES38_09510 [Clavibacter capsici]